MHILNLLATLQHTSTQHTQTSNPTTSINMSTDVDSTTFTLSDLTVPKSSIMMEQGQDVTNGYDVEVSLTTHTSLPSIASFPSSASALHPLISSVAIYLPHIIPPSPSRSTFSLLGYHLHINMGDHLTLLQLYFVTFFQPDLWPMTMMANISHSGRHWRSCR